MRTLKAKGRINGSRNRRPHASTTIHHEGGARRIILRGSLFFAQEKFTAQGSREGDCWQDISRGTSKLIALQQARIEK